MSELAVKNDNNIVKPKKKRPFKNVIKYKFLFLLMAPGVLYYLIFRYYPMYGLTLAFKEFDPNLGIVGSPWIGLKYIKQIFELKDAQVAIFNTIRISSLKILFGFPAPVILALLINEVRNVRFKKTVQTISYLPYFLSWVVVAGLIITVLSPSRGIYGIVCQLLNIHPRIILADSKMFVPMLVITDMWKNVGYGTVIYLATIAGISTELYEAAAIDGAGRFRQCLSITLPSMMPVMSLLMVLSLGSILDAGFDQIFNLYSPLVFNVADIIDTYIYRISFGNFQYSFSAAVTLVKTVIAFTLVMSTNWIAKKTFKYSIW